MNVILLRSLLLASAVCMTSVAIAQEADESALEALDKNAPPKPVLQNEAPGARELREAMRRIALRPTDVDALTDAGNAALLLGDGNAALNFFTRANALQPSNGRIKAGLAAATVRTENPFEALRLFDEAVKLGIPERSIAADRAMAFDLLGNFERAQQDYRLARSASTSDELIVQQAISLSLLGRKNDADAMLVPLLKKESPSAWRARAFLLAARGDLKESTKVAQGFLDASSAQRVERYLRLMPQLTGAQQAAAIHLGHFPANNIGRDSDAVRSVAATIPPVANPIGSGRLIPSGDPLGPRNVAVKPGKESKQDKREREKAEKANTEAAKLASAKGASTASNKSTSKSGVSTDIARARIEEAAKASMSVMTARDLPVPQNTRPTVKVILPQPEPPAPVKIAVATPAPQSLPPVATQQAPIQQPVVFTKTPVSINTPASSPTPAQILPKPTPPLPSAPQEIATISTKPAAEVQPGLPSQNTPVQGPILQNPAPQTPVPQTPVPQIPVSQTPAPVVGPGFESLPPEPKPAQATAPITTPAQGPMPNGAVVQAPKTDAVFTSNAPDQAPVVNTAAVSLPPPAESAPAIIETKPVEPAPFDLGAFVGAIEIPESEQKPSAVPVDLKKIKPATPKAVQSEVDAKGKPVANTAGNPPRIWVQIATTPVAGASSEFRNWAKKKPDLFKGREGWATPWSKSVRLLVGPFADMKTAKKWEADFRKDGGNGFVWSSEKGVIVDRLKSK
jgi:Flp pilus assembly protein TadD